MSEQMTDQIQEPKKKLEASEKVIKNADKLLKPTSYDIRAYVGEPDNFFSDDAVFTPEAAEVIGKILGCQEFILRTGRRLTMQPGYSIVIGYDNGQHPKLLQTPWAKASQIWALLSITSAWPHQDRSTKTSISLTPKDTYR